jgi:hypothetical protein
MVKERGDVKQEYGTKEAKSTWLKLLIMILILEKIIQHVVVTMALYFNWRAIRATVAVSPTALMLAGVLVALLFALSLWAMVVHRGWALDLVIVLALFDILGEFVAQGRLTIATTVSFVAAILLLLLALAYRRTWISAMRAERQPVAQV